MVTVDKNLINQWTKKLEKSKKNNEEDISGELANLKPFLDDTYIVLAKLVHSMKFIIFL